MRKGKTTPSILSESPDSLMTSTKPLAVTTAPSTPPAAVIKMMGPAVLSALEVMSWNSPSFFCRISRGRQDNRASIRAMTGLPRKVSTAATFSGMVIRDAMLPSAISTMGSTMGRKASAALQLIC